MNINNIDFRLCYIKYNHTNYKMILLKCALCLNGQIINSIVSQGFFQIGLKHFNGIVAVVWELILGLTNLVAKRYG